MRHEVETIYGELLIGYDFEKRTRQEEGHGIHTFDESVIELTSVELVISGEGMDILDKLTPKQKQAIINELNDL
jgi:hypothetical protein